MYKESIIGFRKKKKKLKENPSNVSGVKVVFGKGVFSLQRGLMTAISHTDSD